MALPTPVLSDDNIVEIEDFHSIESARLIWNNWNQDPIKAAVLQALLLCVSARPYSYFYWCASVSLGQNRVCSLHALC